MDDILKIENVSKSYPGFSIKNMNIELPKGCIMGFIGENGSGKSTTIKLIMDLIHKDSGKITVLGHDNTKLTRDIKEHIGVVMDDMHFSGELTSRDIGKFMRRIYKTWQQQNFENMLRRYRIPEDKRIKDYSKGMKMKLSIAAALAHDPQLLIMDEATSGLDPVVREEVLDMLLDFIQNENNSVFISSHILSDLEKICDYITFIHNGKILLTDSKDELLERYGIVKCPKEALGRLDSSAVISSRENAFGAEALVFKHKVPPQFTIDNVNLEQIMLFYIKESKK